MSFKDTVAKIKNEYDIVDYIRSNGVSLKQSGVSTYEGLCPFHSEKTPSFKVNVDFQNYRCFGCGASGDIIEFAQHAHSTDFVGAVRFLAADKGIEIESLAKDENSVDFHSVYSALEHAQEFYREQYRKLDKNHAAKQEVLKRGLNVDNELYGYSLEAPNELYKYLKNKGHTDEIIKQTNLVSFFDDKRSPWDFFHGRLMITLADFMGRPVTFTARKLYEDDKMKGKYVNGKESVIFSKKNNLFGIDKAKKSIREKKQAYVVEGQFDQISMSENNIENVVATSGTAFTSEHSSRLSKLVGPEGQIIFIFDGDKAGIKAAIEVYKNFPELHEISYAITLEEGKDPCDYIQAGGIDSLMNYVSSTLASISDFVIDQAFEATGSGSNRNARNQFVSTGMKLVEFTKSPHVESNMMSRISILSAVPIDTVKKLLKKDSKSNAKDEIKFEAENSTALDVLAPSDKLMISALALLVRDPLELAKLTPSDINNKFKPFLKEIDIEFNKARKQGKRWAFIAENYSNAKLAKVIRNHEFIGDPRDDLESMKLQYVTLVKKSIELNRREVLQQERANKMSSIVDMTDANQIAKALEALNK